MKYKTKPCKHIGKKFGRLTVLEKVGNRKNGATILKCQCDCGTIKNINYCNLSVKNGKGTLSCGCYHKEVIASKNPWLTEYNKYICSTVKSRNLSFTLTQEQFQHLCQSSCFYCQTRPQTKMHVGKDFRNGIDRICSDQGYNINNVVPCCHTCNIMKNTLSQDEFLNKIKIIYHTIIQPPHSQ
jgi:hypothetical protein